MKNKVCITLLVMISIFIKSFSQTPETKQNDGYDKIFTKVPFPAQFPGGGDSLNMYVKNNLNPKVSKKIKISQTLIILITVDKEGEPYDIKVISRETNEDFVKEALRIIKSGPKWIPARLNGRNVTFQAKVQISCPFFEDRSQ